ncbi:MAG: chemotaxis protein CheC [Chloroflexota bacterium]|jgi:chemotaxis protein CheC
MMNRIEFDEKLVETLRSITTIGIHNAVRGFSGLLGHHLEFHEPKVKVVPLTQIPMIVGGPENEAVGIYLRAEGDFNAQIMMILGLEKALNLVDLLLEQPEGKTTCLGSLERSALGEVGNMTGTFFMNAVANSLRREIRPTPPAVMVDMVGAILDIIVATTGGVSDQVLLLQTCFTDGDRSVLTDFWVIPDAQSLQALRQNETGL